MATDRLATLGTGAALLDFADEEPAPERIGAHRITERIGQGGMGSVYRGERSTGDFAHVVVAIKVIKPALLGDALIARFRREREILAGLRQPEIAQLYDGGETEDGSPFIVMKYVDGEPLPQWLERLNLARELTQTAMIEAHGDHDAKRGKVPLARASVALSAVPADRRDDAWMGARSEVRRAQLDLATLDQDADAMARLAGLLDAEIEEWPVRTCDGYAAKFDHANAAHYRRIRLYFTDELAESLPEFEREQAGIRQLAHTRPNDPLVLHMLAFNAYVGFGAADGLDPLAASRFLKSARGSSEQLLKLKPRDHTLEGFAIKIRSADAHSLSVRGRTAEALAIQRGVVAYYEVKAAGKRGDAGLNQFTTAHVILGNIAVRAKDRALACENHRLARGDIAALERSGAAMGHVAEHKAGLDGNLRLCASGAPVAALEILDWEF